LFQISILEEKKERKVLKEEEEDEGNTIFIHEPMKISTSPGNEC
jgi:hypothetical protein